MVDNIAQFIFRVSIHGSHAAMKQLMDPPLGPPLKACKSCKTGLTKRLMYEPRNTRLELAGNSLVPLVEPTYQ